MSFRFQFLTFKKNASTIKQKDEQADIFKTIEDLSSKYFPTKQQKTIVFQVLINDQFRKLR
jgi:hypothetical protein